MTGTSVISSLRAASQARVAGDDDAVRRRPELDSSTRTR